MSRTTRILVTGGEGILATALKAYFPYADYCGRETCDVTRSEHVRNAFNQLKPEIVIHCAAVTSHNAEPMSYVMGNIQGTVNVVAAARKCGARLVFPSTDYLGARREDDPVQPVNAYAASKYAAELSVHLLSTGLAVRGSWYSRLDYSHAATDAFTSKLPVDRAAYYVATLAVSHHTGVVNIAGPRRSLYELALGFNERVVPVERRQIHCGYEIPGDCSLSTEKLTAWLAA